MQVIQNAAVFCLVRLPSTAGIFSYSYLPRSLERTPSRLQRIVLYNRIQPLVEGMAQIIDQGDSPLHGIKHNLQVYDHPPEKSRDKLRRSLGEWYCAGTDYS
jgi:hypothetical protein